MALNCEKHEAQVWIRGGETYLGTVHPVNSVRYNRIRDDISQAEVTVPTNGCCDFVSIVRTDRHELHIFRDGLPVWEGVIVRIEYEWDLVRFFAEDILWVAKRSVIEEGYDHSHPNIGNVISVMQWQLTQQCYLKRSDGWRMTGVYGGDNHIHPIHHADLGNDPREARIVLPYSVTAWEDFDKYGEDYGADYTVVNRDIYFWDVHLAWKKIPDLDEQFISEFPRIVDYGNQLATRVVVTNGKGYAGMAAAPTDTLDIYGYVDKLISNVNESSTKEGPPPREDVAAWTRTAQRNLNGAFPPPVSIVIPANTTLLPGAPWTMDHLFPGAWFQVSIERICRTVTEWQRLHEITFEETVPEGERISFTAVAAPGSKVDPEA